MHIAIVTAGGAGMYCGSCMHDNTWARALMNAGATVSLIPTYTPIRVDEHNESQSRVFYGGINVYLNYQSPFWRGLPQFMKRWLDTPWIINLATRFGVSNDAHELGALTVAMLTGEEGPERTKIHELVDYLCQLKPDVILFSNSMLTSVVPTLRKRYAGMVMCILQGDDIFLENLIPPYKDQALAALRQLAPQFDGHIVHSDYYRQFMSQYLNVSAELFHRLPLGIDLQGHDGEPKPRTSETFTIGFFARICREKGLHRLVDAFRILHQRQPNARLRVGGYLGKHDMPYYKEIERSATEFGDAFEYIGSPDRAGKVAFFKSLDVLSVPTDYHEPKGIYVLEALANGVPVVQPRHGAFPEVIEATVGGLLVEPGNAEELADRLEELMLNDMRRLELARAGQAAVRRLFNEESLANETLTLFRRMDQSRNTAAAETLDRDGSETND